jgi:hypothetical protein
LGYLAPNRYQNGQIFVEKAIFEPKKTISHGVVG